MRKRRIGIDLGGTKISFIDLYSPAEVICEKHIDTPHEKDAILKSVIEHVREMLASDDEEEPAGIGIALAGQVNPMKQSVVFSPNLPFKTEFPIGKMVEEAVQIPVRIGNDANAAAVGEKVFGAAVDMEDFIVLTLGTGIGSGVFADGKMLLGHRHAACEAGHMIIDPGGPPCGCGRAGCLEAFSSGSAIERDAEKAFGRPMSAKEVCEAAKTDDEKAVSILKEAGERLGEGIASLINIFNPEALFFTGSLANAPHPHYFEPAIETARKASFGTMGDGVRFEISELKENIGLLGAAALV